MIKCPHVSLSRGCVLPDWQQAVMPPTSKVEGRDVKANRLVNAASPYLRQHAYNPVDWHVWGPEAFAKAKREGKPNLPICWICNLLLVPCHGAREF